LIRLDEQAIDLTSIPGALEQHGEAGDHTAMLRYPDKPRLDLLHGQLDRVRMRSELSAVHRLVRRGAAMELFQGSAFRNAGRPNDRWSRRQRPATLLRQGVDIARSLTKNADGR